METSEIKEDLKIRDELAERYQKSDFEVNPNGYSVAPWVNSETTSTAFEPGFDAALALMQEDLDHRLSLFGSLN